MKLGRSAELGPGMSYTSAESIEDDGRGFWKRREAGEVRAEHGRGHLLVLPAPSRLPVLESSTLTGRRARPGQQAEQAAASIPRA